MFTRREYDWLGRRFRPYDLVYLDPLVCDPALRKRGQNAVSRLLRRPASEDQNIRGFLHEFTAALGLHKSDGGIPEYWRENGTVADFKRNRAKQKQLITIIDRYIEKLGTRHFVRVASLRRTSVTQFIDQPQGGSLVFVDAMLGYRNKASTELQMASQVATQPSEGSLREGICFQLDTPTPVAGLGDACITLMVDQQALYGPTSDQFQAILGAGWYPFSRAVGFLASAPGGHYYLNVLAILVRPYPSLDELMVPKIGETPRCSLSGMLRHVRETALDPELLRMREEAGRAKTGAPSNDTDRGSPAGEVDAGGARSTPKVYDRDSEFLSPVYLSQLCCDLNRTSGDSLKHRAKQTYLALVDYLAQLREMGTCLKQLGVESLIREEHEAQHLEIDKLLPKPQEITNRELDFRA